MLKQDEIELLNSFRRSGSYFNELFSDADIDQMCENIRNDFPIEMGLKCFAEKDKQIEEAKAKAANAEARVNMLEADSLKRKEEVMANVIIASACDDCYDGKLREYVESEVGIEFVIKTKSAHDFELDSREIRYLVSLLK